MTGEAWAAIVAALITAVATFIATNFNDIKEMLQRSSRSIAGDLDSYIARYKRWGFHGRV